MNTITLQDIKKRGSKAIPNDKVVYLIVNSKVQSVVVPPDQYEMMVDALEELEDIAYIKAHQNEETIPLDKAFPKGL